MLNFNDVVDRAMRDESMAGLRPVVEKEVLHYDILHALDRERLLDRLVFQGGTSLRLCRGAPRFSEDLDFVGGHAFAPSQLEEIRECVMDHIGRRYELEIRVKQPKEMQRDPNYFGIEVDRWQIAVQTNPARPDFPAQKIKIEVANVPAYTSELVAPRRNYPHLPDGYDDILIPTETIDEIMADKVVSLVACKTHPRHRDIWDLRWLKQSGAELNFDLVQRKISDYRLTDYEKTLSERIDGLKEVVMGKPFKDEMSRFISPDARRRTFDRDGFTEFLLREVRGTLEDVRAGLYEHEPEHEFML